MHPRDPHKRVEALASDRHVVVSLGDPTTDGVVLGETRRPVLLFETGLPTRFYLPEEDISTEALEPSRTTSFCPYKGAADRYWSVRGRPDATDIAWSYAAPFPAVGKIAGRVAFYNELVDLTVDGVRLERTDSPFSSRAHRPGAEVDPFCQTDRMKAGRPTEPDPRPDPTDRIRASVNAYAEVRPHVEEFARRLAAWLTTVLDDAGINYQYIAWRGKSVASFAAKTTKAVDGVPLYPDPLRDIPDQIGTRIITYVTSDVTAAADLIRDQLGVVGDLDLGQQVVEEGRFGYVSRHLQVDLDPIWLGTLPAELVPVGSAQVQIRTVLQHAWAEYEHDIRYKGTVPDGPDVRTQSALHAGRRPARTRRPGVRDHSKPDARTRGGGRTRGRPGRPRIENQELAAFLAGHYPEAGWSRTDHYTWISGLLLELGITSLRELAGLLAGIDSAALIERMGYRYPPGAVRRLDDALLASFAHEYIRLHGNTHRAELLRNRLDKLRGSSAAQPAQE